MPRLSPYYYPLVAVVHLITESHPQVKEISTSKNFTVVFWNAEPLQVLVISEVIP